MIKIFHKNAIVYQNAINSSLGLRTNTYISFSEEKEEYSISFSQSAQTNFYVAKIGVANYFNEKQSHPITEELVLAKEFLIKHNLLCKFGFERKIHAYEKFNLERKAYSNLLMKEIFLKFARAKQLKAKIKKLNSQANLSSLMDKSDLELCLC